MNDGRTKTGSVSAPPRVVPPPPPRNVPVPRAGRLQLDADHFVESFARHMRYSIVKDGYTASDYDVYMGLAIALRDRLVERWFRTQDAYYKSDAKRVYYLSMEFLTGRALLNNALNLGVDGPVREAMERLGYDLEDIQQREWDAGLGNGGLGRLAACFLDSAATLGLPFYGYGIRYEYGIFRQVIENGFQVEQPDNWLRYGNPWEIARPDALFPVRFYGRTSAYRDEAGVERTQWVDTETIYAMAYDTPVIGYKSGVVNSLRLWAAKSSREFDLATFNAGNYVKAVEDKTQTENISKVLYPPDDQYAGKELRLKQQYFFVSATLQDLIRRFRKRPNHRWQDFPDKVAIQLNDTHPAVAIPELMRVLVDEERLEWDAAWDVTQRTFGYTNHTVLPEALETWPLEIFGRLLPRHQAIIEEIDRRFCDDVRSRYPNDEEKVARMSLFRRDGAVSVRMANLAIVGSHAVNGVAKLHTDILKAATFADFHTMLPGRISNKTNGITPRRWLSRCNAPLARLVTEAIGDGWTRNLEELRRLEAFVEDAAFRQRWAAVKRANKVALSNCAKKHHGFGMDPDSLFDVQIKRLHEYKRQLLNVLHVIALYNRIQAGEDSGVPRTVIFGGKAAPGYVLAKLIIRLIHAVADLVNGDPACRGRLAVFFSPNYSVSAAELLFPATELSEQTSTAGTEASGTGNMKACLNGGLIIGTLDGANIEIQREVGDGNIFIFGHTAAEVAALKRSGYNPMAWIETNPELGRVMRMLDDGVLDGDQPGLFRPIVESLVGADRYLHCADFGSYVECQKRASETYAHPEWTRMSIRNTAGMGKFSSDRTVQEYATDIWKVVPVAVPQE